MSQSQVDFDWVTGNGTFFSYIGGWIHSSRVGNWPGDMLLRNYREGRDGRMKSPGADSSLL